MSLIKIDVNDVSKQKPNYLIDQGNVRWVITWLNDSSNSVRYRSTSIGSLLNKIMSDRSNLLCNFAFSHENSFAMILLGKTKDVKQFLSELEINEYLDLKTS